MASAPDTLSSNRLHSEPRFLKIAATTNDVNLVGGKGLGLSRLIRAGLPIPPSFCVTSAAFHDVLSSVVHDAADLELLAVSILDAELPESLISAIDEVVSRNPAASWAVRSSAIGEDGASMSMAGQQVTRLHVRGLAGVLRAIKEVWVSLFSIDALLYRAEFDATHAVPAGIAVILQPMLEPVAAGVLFTTDAMGSSEEAVVTATHGLGVGVVDGSDDATTYYIERPSGYLRRRSGAENPLSPPQLAQLAQLSERLEALFQQPQDIEWAYVPGDPLPRLMLLQMRPITARSEAPGEEASAPTVWTNANVGEALPGVGSPMTWSIIHRFSTSGFEQAFGSLGLEVPENHQLVGSFRGRVYLNLTEFMSIASGIPILSPEVLFSVAGGGGVELVRDIYERRSAREFLLNLPLTIPRIIASQLSMPVVASWWEEHFKRHCEGFFLRDLGRLNHSQLASSLEEVDRLFERNGLIMLACSSNFLMCYVVMREALKLAGGREAVAHEQLMVSGLDTRSAEPGLKLLELGRLARRSLRLRKLISTTPPSETLATLQKQRDKADVAEFLDDLESFRANYGHRAPREAELTTPRWRED
ncbi:MAG: PEP/pyruvate-binding domain-containing protein, partial [Myxococcota bacterium]|nr:PEP/pyruvate-binding domain-containing protein [Myxococcota bacterium]